MLSPLDEAPEGQGKDKEKIMPDVSPRDVEKHLKGVNYPATKADLVTKAKMEGASKDILDALQSMPGQTFNGPTDVARAIGQEDRASKPRT